MESVSDKKLPEKKIYWLLATQGVRNVPTLPPLPDKRSFLKQWLEGSRFNKRLLHTHNDGGGGGMCKIGA